MSKTNTPITRKKTLRPCNFVNMRLFYEEERNEDFFNVCESIRKESGSYISVSDIVKKAIHHPAKSFYLSARACYVIIRRARHARPRLDAKYDLYTEIYTRHIELSKENPQMAVSQIARIISEQSAPRFYISAPRAMNLYYQLLKKPSLV